MTVLLHTHLAKMLSCCITIIILDNIHHYVFCLKHDVSESGVCLCLQVEPTQMGFRYVELCVIIQLILVAKPYNFSIVQHTSAII
jgi:hypothetical protein